MHDTNNYTPDFPMTTRDDDVTWKFPFFQFSQLCGKDKLKWLCRKWYDTFTNLISAKIMCVNSLVASAIALQFFATTNRSIALRRLISFSSLEPAQCRMHVGFLVFFGGAVLSKLWKLFTAQVLSFSTRFFFAVAAAAVVAATFFSCNFSCRSLNVTRCTS